MASETFVSAMMLITAVVASAILITAVFPIVWTMVSTFSSASHETDTRMRTDFKIVTYYAKAGTWAGSPPWSSPPNPQGDIYLKNIGSSSISVSKIQKSDVFFGKSTEFTHLALYKVDPPEGKWTYQGYSGSEQSYDLNMNKAWDPGETLHIIAYPQGDLASPNSLYFQFVLPNG
ncbi:MAG: hypothetical protein NTW33_10825, partial [Methanoregula sp.]|nr:hypothetical protein [Methanoregula sp.]